MLNQPLYRRGFLMSLAGAAGVGALMAATDKMARGPKNVRIVDFDANGNKTGAEEVAKIVKTDDEWRKQLTAEQFDVTRKEGTERAGSGKYAYNDADGSTGYDREFAYMLTELWSAAHYRDAHIQVNDWTDYAASFWLLNGRGYPDTLAPNGDPLLTAAGRLQYQPISSLVTCNAGERVLLRMSNLGYQNHQMSVDNIDLTVVAKDASLLRGRDGTRNYLTTNGVDVGPGESRDVLFTAPAPGEYLLYDRNYSYLDNGGGPGYGGMMTKIVVRPAGTLGPQSAANA